jgi:hypothetical protein
MSKMLASISAFLGIVGSSLLWYYLGADKLHAANGSSVPFFFTAFILTTLQLIFALTGINSLFYETR